VLANSTADYLVVAGHYPIYSVCEHGPTASLIQQLKPLLEHYKVNAYLAGHDHCMEYLNLGGNSSLDHHGIGSAHVNDPSTAHESAVPVASLKFHAQGVGGGFASFVVSTAGLTVRHHNGDGEVVFTAPANAPRPKGPYPPPPPMPPPPPAPPAPPPPAPTPSGKTWACHDGTMLLEAALAKLSLKDVDLQRGGGPTTATCEAACNGAAGCVAVQWHGKDKHCHTYVGTANPAAIEAALTKDTKQNEGRNTCIMMPAKV
jgi:hypothetical protein